MIRYLDNKENITIKAGIILCMLLWCVSGIMCVLSVEEGSVEDEFVEDVIISIHRIGKHDAVNRSIDINENEFSDDVED